MNEHNDNPGGPACSAGVDTRARVLHIQDVDIPELKGVDGEQWTAINNLRNRLPTWATAIISLLSFLLGIAVSYIAFLSR